MPRKIAFSHKQKKLQLKEKRAIKRGDKEAPPPPSTKRRKTKGVRRPDVAPRDPAVAVVAAARLQSAFHTLSKSFLDDTGHLAAVLPLVRPVPPERAIWEAPNDASVQLTCPARPKWHYEMSKKEVERNEEGHFAKWLARTDAAVDVWCTPPAPAKAEGPPDEEDVETPPQEIPQQMPRAPTSFERNPEVWRQLWRVTEISQIILVLLDARCPLLHYPPSLEAYLASPHLAHTRTILVLTKVDIAGAARADAWTRYLRHRFPHLRVVQVESYAEKPASGSAGSSKKTYEPHLPSVFRQTLVDALKEAHAELLKAPERTGGAPGKAAKSRLRRVINWDEVLRAHGGNVGAAVSEDTAPRHSNAGEDPQHENTADPDANDNEDEPEYLTVGLIGQPNVGKSSLLNALFGTQRVSTSKQPGKTKHFQTLFWTPEVRLVDCPGLVMPNLVPLETQVLTGILPNSRVSAVPLCVHYVGQLLPLEQLFALTHPAPPPPPPELDKRTWREPRRAPAPTDTDPHQPHMRVWTTIDLLTAFALKHGWMTAKTGWPDTHRAGNAILRMLAEGRVRWAFWPPGTPPETVRQHQHDEGVGIWAADGDADVAVHDVALYDGVHDRDRKEHGPGTDSESESESESEDIESDEEEDDDEEGVEGEPSSPSFVTGRFGALEVSGDDDDVSNMED